MTQPAERWHQHYDDPRDDLVLVSKDNVKFRVSSHRLAKVSPVFKDMIGLPGKSSLDSIPLDHPASTIEDFLNITTIMGGEALLALLNFHRGLAFLKFTELFGCDMWLTRATAHIFKVKGRDPIAIFDYAVDRDDWRLGARAMKEFSWASSARFDDSDDDSGDDSGNDPGEEFAKWLEAKPLAWQLALLRSTMYRICFLSGTVDWAGASIEFVKTAQACKRESVGGAAWTPADGCSLESYGDTQSGQQKRQKIDAELARTTYRRFRISEGNRRLYSCPPMQQ